MEKERGGGMEGSAGRPQMEPPQLVAGHVKVLEKVLAAGFEVVAFPRYASHVGVRRGECAVLLKAKEDGSFEFFGEPVWMIEGNLAVKIVDGEKRFFVWKGSRVEVTREREEELGRFRSEVEGLIQGRS